MDIENTPWRSKLVIEAKHLCKSFGDRTIVNDFSTKIIRGNRIGIVGPNGAGKTTLIKLLTKKLAPDSGFVRIGKNLKKPILIRTVLSLTRAKPYGRRSATRATTSGCAAAGDTWWLI